MAKVSFRAGICFLLFAAGIGATLWRWTQHGTHHVPVGWGIDAVLSRHVPAWQILGYQNLLTDSGVGILRERGVASIQGSPEKPGAWRGDVREKFRRFEARGHKVVAFAHLPFAAKPVQAGNQLPEDLHAVYEQGRFMGREFAGLVDAWEMVGEPDLGYCADLPDRVAAYQKALYLGLKAGAHEAAESENDHRKLKAGSLYTDSGLLASPPNGHPSLSASGHDKVMPSSPLGSLRSQVSGLSKPPVVLMGALGMPPGPWLDRFAANDGLEYTDAYNFHFYGHAKDLTGVIEAHRAAIKQLSVRQAQDKTEAPFPFWITECGINAVPKDDFLNPKGRQLQADFTVETARQALAAKDVAVFMPFILVHKDDPYAMTLSADKPLPAWNAYAKFTRENPWPERALSRERGALSPVVVQWLPDNRTTLPRKVGGTYRFIAGQPIKGEFRIYNFSEREIQGELLTQGRKDAGRRVEVRLSEVHGAGNIIAVPAMGMVSVPVELVPRSNNFFRETIDVSFVEKGVDGPRVCKASFGVESMAPSAIFDVLPIELRALPDGVVKFSQSSPYTNSGQVGVWTLMNGVRARSSKVGDSNTPQVSGFKSQVSGETSFWIEHHDVDWLSPTMAVAAVDGLPKADFLRVELSKPMSKDCKVLVVLVDDRGQRYSIWENLGADYYGPRDDIWLNYEDIHADFWGAMSADYRFRPERIREVHLRLYLSNPNEPVGVNLSLLKAKP